MDETGAYDSIKPRLQRLGLDPQRVEDITSRGTPDVWYTAGAIEMKYLAEWPKRASTPVMVSTLIDRPQQVAWLTRRWLKGGPAWLMIRIADQYLLFTGPDSRLVRKGLISANLERLAVWTTDERGRGDWAALRNWLTWNLEGLRMIDRSRLRSKIAGNPDDTALI